MCKIIEKTIKITVVDSFREAISCVLSPDFTAEAATFISMLHSQAAGLIDGMAIADIYWLGFLNIL